MSVRRLLCLVPALLALGAAPARADLTAFLGAGTQPSARSTVGLSAGLSLVIVGFEFEYAQTGPDDDCVTGTETCAPSLRTGSANVLLQTPRGVLPLQFYGTAGIGFYRERFEALDIQETGLATNVGGGVKVDLAGPLRLRLDYRLFKLADAVHTRPQRFYAGLTLAF